MAIDPDKDVDGFHPVNVGRLSTGQKCFLPCTPAGVMEMLKECGIDPKGKDCVVVGRSNIVGKPMAMLLLAAHGTVTVLPFPHQRSGRGLQESGYPGGRCREAEHHHGGYGEGGSRGYRCGYEPRRGGEALRRCRLWACGEKSLLHYPGTRRRGAYDPGDADGKYAGGGPACTGNKEKRCTARVPEKQGGGTDAWEWDSCSIFFRSCSWSYLF